MVSDSVSPWPDTAAIEKRHGLCLAGPNCDTCRWLATLDAERAKHAAELEAIESRLGAQLIDRDLTIQGLRDKIEQGLQDWGAMRAEVASLKGANARLEAAVSAYGALVGMTLAHCEECFARPATRKGDDFGWCDRCTPFDDGAMFDVPNAAAIRAVEAALAPPQPMHMPTCGFELGASHTDRWACDTRCPRHPLRHVTLAPPLPKVHCSQCGIATIWNRLDADGRAVCGDFPFCQPPQPTGDIIHNPGLSSVTVTAEQAAQLLGKPTGDGQVKL